MSVIKENSYKAWLLAIRPRTLSGAAIPVLLGSALAYSDGAFKWFPALVCLVFAVLMQIAANFINDLYDFLKGTDTEERLGPKRACAQGWISEKGMKKGIAFTILLACAAGSMLLFYGGWELILVGMACLLGAYFYTAGPYPLAYYGWGDVLVIIFFGFIPVGITYYIQAHTWNIAVTVVSLISGFAVDTLLVVNNYRDRETDKKNKKNTLVVRFGEPFGRYLYLFLGICASLFALYFLYEKNYRAALLPQFYLIFHFITWKKMKEIFQGKELNIILGETSRNILIIGILLVLGIITGIN